MATASALIARLENAVPDFRVAPTISTPSRRCSARSWSTTRRSTGSPTSSARPFLRASAPAIFEIAAELIRAGKVATPITLKTFLGDQDLGGVTVSQYLARLAAEATTVINAEDYGRTIYDLAIRRSLISIGEDMVNIAYDAPVDILAARRRSRRPSAGSSSWPRPAATTAASSASPRP